MAFPASVASYLPVDIARIVYDYDEETENYDKVMFELMSNEHICKMREHLEEKKYNEYKWTIGMFYDSLDGEERDLFEFIW